MAKRKGGKTPMPATEKAPTRQARLELPVAEFERVRAAAKGRGLSVSAFIRMAVLKETKRIEEGRD